MIKELFLPEWWKNKRVYAQRILGFAIQDDLVTCVQDYVKRNGAVLENIFEEKIVEGTPENYKDRVAQSIKNILEKVKNYDQIRISVPASMVVFKELDVPFKDPDKIRMILDYEVESMLPFSVQDAVIDFIITNQVPTQNNARILVAALQNQDLSQILEIYNKAGVDPNVVTLDLFANYSLFLQVLDYQKITANCAIIDLASNSTRVSFLENGQLRLTRLIPNGITSIPKNVAAELNLNLIEVENKFLNSGFQLIKTEEFEKSLKNNAINFFNEIQFTLNSFSLKLNSYQGISKIIFTGKYSNLKDLIYFCQDILQTSCEVFSFEKVLSSRFIKNNLKQSPKDMFNYLTALGTTLPSPNQVDFDLRRKSFILKSDGIINKQLITSLVLIFAIFLSITVNGFFQIYKLSSEIDNIEKRESERLKKVLPKDFKLKKDIKFNQLLKESEKAVSIKKEQWAPLLQEKLDTVAIIQEITQIIEKRRFDVSVKELLIKFQNNAPYIEVSGIFRSKTGTDHATNWGVFEKRFTESFFTLAEQPIDMQLAPENTGVTFNAKLKFLEEEKE